MYKKKKGVVMKKIEKDKKQKQKNTPKYKKLRNPTAKYTCSTRRGPKERETMSVSINSSWLFPDVTKVWRGAALLLNKRQMPVICQKHYRNTILRAKIIQKMA